MKATYIVIGAVAILSVVPLDSAAQTTTMSGQHCPPRYETVRKYLSASGRATCRASVPSCSSQQRAYNSCVDEANRSTANPSSVCTSEDSALQRCERSASSRLSSCLNRTDTVVCRAKSSDELYNEDREAQDRTESLSSDPTGGTNFSDRAARAACEARGGTWIRGRGCVGG